MERPFPSYKGDDPYIFVSYSHDDADIVYPGISWLRDQGFNIWYDEGISPGASWREELAEAILKCDLFVILVSPRSAKSHNCLKEVNFALEHNRQILAIHQEPTELSPGLQLALSDRQAIFRHELNDEQYRDKILAGVKSHIQPSHESTSTTPPPPVRKEKNNRSVVFAAAAVALIAVIAVGFALLAPDSDESVASTSVENTMPEAGTNTADQVRSNWIAVLPFDVLSEDAESRSLATGLTPQMIRALQPIDNFSIVNYRAVEKYRDRSTEIGEIARELNVRYLIDGNIQRSGDRTRIGIELVDGVLGQSFWQETLTYSGNDSLAIQDEVSLLTTRILSARLDSIEMKRLETLPREQLSADQLSLLAAGFWLDPNQENLGTAIADVRQALVLDPDNPGATAQLAHFLAQSIQMGESEDPAATQTEVCRLADRAMLLARDDQGINTVTFALTDVCGDAQRAVQLMERLIAVNPESATLWATYSYPLIQTGQIQAAREAIDKARSLDPNGLWVWYLALALEAITYANEGNWTKAAELATKAVNDNPGLYWLQQILANAHGLNGDFEAAREQWKLVTDRFPRASADRLHWVYRQNASIEIADKWVEGLRRAGIE